MGIVFERRRAQEQHMTTESRDWRDGSPRRLAGMPGRTTKPLCFVHDEQVDACLHGLFRELRTLGEHLQRNDGSAMNVERVEVLTEVACDVCQTGRVEEREDLVVLPPQLAEPLHRQCIRRDNETAFDLPRMYEPIQDQRRFDGFSEADLVGEQPSNRVSGSRALCDVELVGEEADASSEERPEPIGLAKCQQMKHAQTRQEVLDLVQIAQGQAFEQCAFELQWPQRVGRRRLPIRELQRSIRLSRRDRRLFAGGGDPDRPAGIQIDGDERVGVGRQPQFRPRAREFDDERTAFDGRDSSNSQLRVESVGEVVPSGPGAQPFLAAAIVAVHALEHALRRR